MGTNQLFKPKYLSRLIIFSLIPLITISSFLPQSKDRNLQNLQNLSYTEFSSKGIYYKVEFPKNDITGTGDKLQDIPYKALCLIKSCVSGCCEGDIDKIQCGTEENCKNYYDSTKKGNVAAAVIIPILVTAIFLITSFVLRFKYHIEWDLSLLYGFTCMFVITIPFVIWHIMKTKPFGKFDGKKNQG